MSAVDLVILGYLKKSSASACEMAQNIEASRLKKIIKIGSPTIYQNIKKLAEKEYLSSKTLKKGEMPEKKVYFLTKKGEAHFIELMTHYSTNPGRMFFSFNGFIKNLTLVDQKKRPGDVETFNAVFLRDKKRFE
ncbi:MAG: PadR family transcriptional regulator [Desulfobacteraceae bacterium]|nr:PadR family transcriptional regulator [Desulfobacteraceae bacterium]